MTIGEIAKAASVPTSTLRYYERAGLLAPPARTAARYRVYDEESLQRLRFIRGAQTVGFTLDDIRLLLSLNSDAPCEDVQQLLELRIAHVDRKVAEMKYLRSTLAKALDRCRKSKRACPVLTDLKSRGP